MLSLAEAQTDQPQDGVATTSVAALAAHDPSAWQELFERYYRRLYRFAYVRTGDASAAEEIAAESFVAAAKGISRYRETGAPFGSWLYRIARNLTADHLERRRRRPVLPLEAVEIVAGAWSGGVEDAADIAKALARLTGDQQEVIVLRFFDDCSLQEAATALGKSVGAVKVLQHRALAALRKHLTAGGRP